MLKMNREDIAESHCCREMNEYLQDKRIPIVYSPMFREYALPLGYGSSAKQCLFFCPWCGSKLPSGLRDIFFEILEKEHGLEPNPEILLDPRLPEEFKSDLWWKKRKW